MDSIPRWQPLDTIHVVDILLIAVARMDIILDIIRSWIFQTRTNKNEDENENKEEDDDEDGDEDEDEKKNEN